MLYVIEVLREPTLHRFYKKKPEKYSDKICINFTYTVRKFYKKRQLFDRGGNRILRISDRIR